MKVLNLIHSIERGGAETYLLSIADGFDRSGTIDLHIVCSKIGSNHKVLEGKKVDIIPMANVFDIFAAYKVARYCKDNHIDIVQTHFLREHYIAVLSRIFNPKVKIVWMGHLLASNSSIIKMINKLMFRFVSKLICVSEAVKTSYIEEGLPNDKLLVIYNGVDTNRFDPDLDHPAVYDIVPKDKVILTTISRLNKDKGHDFLVDCAQLLQSRSDDYFFLMIGSGEEEGYLREKITRLGLDKTVIMAGFREDTESLLARTNIYISPSKSEAISFSILEAVSMGLPIVATEVGGVPEIFAKGDIGELVPYGDSEALVRAVEAISTKSLIYDSKAIREVAVTYFSVEKMLDSTLELYFSITKGDV